jgi:hypothetical protein
MTINVPVELAAVIAAPLVTFVIWLLRLEGRINVHEANICTIQEDLRYIRGRIDEAINGHAGV